MDLCLCLLTGNGRRYYFLKLPIQKVLLYINVTSLLERSQLGLSSHWTNPCEKLDPKAVEFGSCDLGSTHSSVTLPLIVDSPLCCRGFRPPSHISQNPLPSSSIYILLMGSTHGAKFASVENFIPSLPCVLVTAVKATSG